MPPPQICFTTVRGRYYALVGTSPTPTRRAFSRLSFEEDEKVVIETHVLVSSTREIIY